MKTYEIYGHYNGKVRLTCEAKDLQEAVSKLITNGYEDTQELCNASYVEVDESTLREVK